MNSPRWFLIATSLLLLNMLAVVTTSYLRHAQATEPPADSGAVATAPRVADSQTPAVGNNALQAPPPASTTPPASSATAPNPLDNIPIPDQMPEIPSLANPDILKHDPGFQEFRRLFALEEESWDSAPPLLSADPSASGSSQYFQSLDQRLQTVEQLCSAARSLAQQAAQQSSNGKTAQSQELIRMTTQLRDMAAKLLVMEL